MNDIVTQNRSGTTQWGTVHFDSKTNRELFLLQGDAFAITIKVECEEHDLWELVSDHKEELTAAIAAACRHALGYDVDYQFFYEHGSLWVNIVGCVKSIFTSAAASLKQLSCNVRDGVKRVWQSCKEVADTPVGRFIVKGTVIVVRAATYAAAAITIAQFLGFGGGGIALMSFLPGLGWT